MTTMLEMLDVRAKTGEVGVEIELEGTGLPRSDTQYWRIEADGSLRGEAVEMVMKQPSKRQHLDKRLAEFTSSIRGATIKDSGRAGIHIHINIQELTPKELCQFMCLYLVFENTLVEWCGSERVGNLFCLRCEDAPGLLEHLRTAFKEEHWDYLNTDEIRYASMNAKAVATYGSLEFRAMRSTADTGIIAQWARMLLALKDRAKRFASPMEIVEGMSLKGTEGFFEEVLGTFPGLKFRNSDMMIGVRNAQQIAYSRQNWDELEVKTSDYAGLDVVPEELEEIAPDLGVKLRRGEAPEHAWMRGEVAGPDRKPKVEGPDRKPKVEKRMVIKRPDATYYKVYGDDGPSWVTENILGNICRHALHGELKQSSKRILISFYKLHWPDVKAEHHPGGKMPLRQLNDVYHKLMRGDL